MNLTVPVVPILVPTKKREKPTLFCKCCAKLWKSWAAEFCELTRPAVASAEGSSVTAQTENRQEIMHTYIMERVPYMFMFSMFFPAEAAVWWYIYSTKIWFAELSSAFLTAHFYSHLVHEALYPHRAAGINGAEGDAEGHTCGGGCRMGRWRGCLTQKRGTGPTCAIRDLTPGRVQWFLYLSMSALASKVHVSAWLGALSSCVLHSMVCDVPGRGHPSPATGPHQQTHCWGAPVLPRPPDLSSLAMMVKSSPMGHSCSSLLKVT